MKILVVCGAGYISGLEVVTLSLIKGLHKRGHDIRCVTTTWGDGNFAARLNAIGIQYIKLPLGFVSKTLSWSAVIMTLDQMRKLPRLWLGYYRYTRDFKPDIVIHSNFQHIFLLWPLLNRNRNVYHVHNNFASARFYRILFRFLSLRLNNFIGVSKYVANSLIKLGIPKDKVSFVHNGIDIQAFPQGGFGTSSDISSNKINENGNSATIRIGIVGQIGEWKGHDDLFEALCLLKAKGISFVCSVFGKGHPTYISALKNKLNQCGLLEQVQWMGFLNKAEDIFPTLDICVVPSRVQEGFGMVAIEAAFFGVPVIATSQGGLPEIICDGKTGFLVDANSPEQIAETLSLLVQDRVLRKRLGSAAREYSFEHFTQDMMAEKMEVIFRKVLGADVPT